MRDLFDLEADCSTYEHKCSCSIIQYSKVAGCLCRVQKELLNHSIFQFTFHHAFIYRDQINAILRALIIPLGISMAVYSLVDRGAAFSSF